MEKPKATGQEGDGKATPAPKLLRHGVWFKPEELAILQLETTEDVQGNRALPRPTPVD